MASIRIILRKTQRADGTAPVYIRVIINREALYHPTKVYCLPKFFDKNQGLVLPKDINDTSAHDNNLVIRRELARINEVLVIIRLSGIALTRDSFKAEFYRKGDRNCFLHFMETRMMERYRSRQITYLTLRNHQVTLDLLRIWSNGNLPFMALNRRTAEQFDFFLAKERKNSVNGRWSKHRNFRTYLNDAKKDGYTFVNPYEYFTASKHQSKWTSLTERQLKTLLEVYEKGELPEFTMRILRRFLFGCFTGMRISDLMNFQNTEVREGWLFYSPVKGNARYSKMVRVPLVAKAEELMNKEIELYGDKAFSIAAQYGNRELNKLGKDLLKVRLHNHMSRETFATLFIESGGSLDALKEYLGHTSLKTTEKYIHTSRKRLELQAEFIGKIGQ